MFYLLKFRKNLTSKIQNSLIIRKFTDNIASKPPFTLTQGEIQLFNVFTDTIAQFKTNTVVRIAGGWVRDKITQNGEPYDLDVAVDNMSGLQFANLVVKSLKNKQNIKVTAIQANPAQSKHLETATTKIFGFFIDFTNLRCEMYNSESRIPITQFGSPLDDALRRDFTINSIFYNLNTKQIEDFTQKGLNDIKNKIIQTPILSHQTFSDDPLRILRAIRFACRFYFKIHTDIVETLKDPSVKEGIVTKVTRPRISREIEKMLSGKHTRPGLVFKYFVDLGICNEVFQFPLNYNQEIPANLWETSASYTTWMQRFLVWKALKRMNRSNLLDEKEALSVVLVDNKLEFLSSFFLPTKDMKYQFGKSTLPVCIHIIKESLKLKAKDAEYVEKILSNFHIFTELAADSSNFDRVKAGLCLRNVKDLWVHCVNVACVVELFKLFGNDNESRTSEIIAVMEKFDNLTKTIESSDLDGVWEMRPYFNGNMLVSLFDLPRDHILKELIELQFVWKLQFPSGTPDELLVFLRQNIDSILANKNKTH